MEKSFVKISLKMKIEKLYKRLFKNNWEAK